MWFQKELSLGEKQRGFHLVTQEILDQLPELRNFRIGFAHLFLKHTSASLTINENADPDVRADLESHFNKMVPERAPYFTHTQEGPDDMPAHLKSSILGNTLMLPISRGKLCLGIWQGIYLCEHRNYGGRRNIVITLCGTEK